MTMTLVVYRSLSNFRNSFLSVIYSSTNIRPTNSYCTQLSNTRDEPKHFVIQDVINKWRNEFEISEVSEPKESIEYILAHVLAHKTISDVKKSYHRHVSTAQLKIIDKLCQCRLAHMPVQYIIGEWDFKEMTLKMVPPVFIPRPETEQLVDMVVDHFSNRSESALKILEIGCGSGAIILALLSRFPKLCGTAVDQSLHACRATLDNALALGLSERLRLLQAKLSNENLLTQVLEGPYDCIVSNPPYVPTADLVKLQPEIKLYEDLRALDGGVDGLSVIKPILRLCSQKLVSHGSVYLEVDITHPKLIAEWLQEQPNLNLALKKVYKDYAGKDRFLQIQRLL